MKYYILESFYKRLNDGAKEENKKLQCYKILKNMKIDTMIKNSMYHLLDRCQEETLQRIAPHIEIKVNNDKCKDTTPIGKKNTDIMDKLQQNLKLDIEKVETNEKIEDRLFKELDKFNISVDKLEDFKHLSELIIYKYVPEPTEILITTVSMYANALRHFVGYKQDLIRLLKESKPKCKNK